VRPLLRVALVVAAGAVLACASAHGLRPLSDSLPAGIPTAADRAGWQRIAGDYETDSEHVRYALFVDPARPLLFRVTQYRVTPRVSAPRRAAAVGGVETVIWNAAPGTRAPLRCFAEQRPAAPSGAGGPPLATWRDVSPATAEFVDSMRRAIEIYARVHSEGRAGPRPH